MLSASSWNTVLVVRPQPGQAVTIGVKLRYTDFRIVTRGQTLAQPTADAKTIRHTAGLCLKRVDLARRFRLLGVRVGGLQRLDSLGKPAAAPASPGQAATKTIADSGSLF